MVQSVSPPSFENQTLQDFQVLINVDEEAALALSSAECFLWLSGRHPLQPQAAEECVWALQAAEWVTWRDTGEAPPPSLRRCAGPLGVARAALKQPESKRSGRVRRLPWPCRAEDGQMESGRLAKSHRHILTQPGAPMARVGLSHSGEVSRSRNKSFWLAIAGLFEHLNNAGLLSLSAWRRNPVQTIARLVPLALKQRINDWLGRPFFDLGFYLRFQPGALLIDGRLVLPLAYKVLARSPGRLRVGLLTDGRRAGAEAMLLEAAKAWNNTGAETLAIVLDSADSVVLRAWRQTTDWTYHVADLVPLAQIERFVYSLATNWDFDVLMIQNSVAAYAVAPLLKEHRPRLKIADILHAADEDEDVFFASVDADTSIDYRVVVSETVRRRLSDMAVPGQKIRRIPYGIDLKRFDPARFESSRLRRRLGLSPEVRVVLYTGRLDQDSGTLLIPEAIEELVRRRPELPFHVLILGDGPQREHLQLLISRRSLDDRFTVVRPIQDLAEVLAETAVLLIPSEPQGVPMVGLQALAMGVPVVSCQTESASAALPPDCSILVEPGPYLETRIAAALDTLLGDEPRRVAMGQAGRKLVERECSLEQAHRLHQGLVAELAPRACLSRGKEPGAE